MASEPVAYSTDISDLTPTDLEGFFVGWSAKPSPQRHLEILRGSDHVVIAREGHDGRVIGFITAISDSWSRLPTLRDDAPRRDVAPPPASAR